MTATNPMLTMQPNKHQNPTKLKMNSIPTSVIAAVVILASLPYTTTLNLPSGDPAPGRSPGPPFDENSNIDVPDEVFDEITTTDEIPTTALVSEASVERMVDACEYAKLPSDSDGIVTLSERNSDVNLTVSHSVFDSDELVKGVVYDGKFFFTFFKHSFYIHTQVSI